MVSPKMRSLVLLVLAVLVPSLARRVISTVVRLDDNDIAYYMHSTPVASSGHVVQFGSGQEAEPCTVVSINCSMADRDGLRRTLARFSEIDDVWTSSFLGSVIIQTTGSDNCTLSRDAQVYLQCSGVEKVHYSSYQSIPEGPYFLNNGHLYQAYRIYPDTAGAFIVAAVPADSVNTYRSLDASAYGEKFPSALAIAVPSRLSFLKTADKPFAGARIAIKDVMDLKGLKTGASSRAYTSLYPIRSESAETVQRLIDLGFVIVGKLKTTQFADSEWPTCDWVDYHGPFNPRGDGYLTTSGSSAGSAAAIASYEWLDFSLGTDTLGSIRAPAAAQGIFGMRPSLGAASFRGILPYSPKFDTVGGFARTPSEFNDLVRALYGTPGSSQTPYKKPLKLLYPSDYWPVKHDESQKVFDRFVTGLEEYLGVERTDINLADLWDRTRPEGITDSLTGYFEHVFEWAANPDQWSGFFGDFLTKYESETGKPPVLNPQLRFKRDYLPTVTKNQQSEGIHRLEVYQQWFYKHVMAPSEDGQSESVMVLPWTNGEPVYRDTYKHGPQNFTGIGFFFYNVGTYAEAPEIIVPVEPTLYRSRFTGKTEELPAAVGLVGAKGSDLMLAELVHRMQADGKESVPLLSDHEQAPLLLGLEPEDL